MNDLILSLSKDGPRAGADPSTRRLCRLLRMRVFMKHLVLSLSKDGY
jgi:hypothetical protein